MVFTLGDITSSIGPMTTISQTLLQYISHVNLFIPIHNPTMNNHHRHKKSSSGENFTFPAMSPDIQIDTELADHLFSNGKFLLHTFPLKPAALTTCTFSRTCSVNSSNSTNSKDSLVSSRSTSTNSRSSSSSSSCSSARTSTSDSSLARVPIKNIVFSGNGPRSPVHYGNNYYPPVQRWQFMAPAPVLNRRASLRRKGEYEKRKESSEKRKCYKRKGYCRMFFRWIVSTCKECHAMEPSKKVF